MSVSPRNPPLRRRSLGPVSPKRLYRNLSVRLRGGESSVGGEADTPKHLGKSADAYKTLWDAVENEDTLAVQSLLSRIHNNCKGGGGGGGGTLWERGEKKERDWVKDRERGVNRVSEQGLVPLDVAALTHNSPLLHVLIKAGARHNPILCRPEEWAIKLDDLVTLAKERVDEKKQELLKKAGAGSHAQADVHRQIRLWSLRLQLYCRMKENFHHTELPGPPCQVSIVVTSISSLFVAIKELEGDRMGLITCYKVEWSTSESFKRILGSAQVTETKNPSCSIRGLIAGVDYFVRASAYNVKGWGPPQCSTPVSAAPSSWKECSGVKSQDRNHEALVRKLLEDAGEPHNRGYYKEIPKASSPSMRLSMARGIKQLFQSATKFVRLLQRGVYLATVFYHKENILVTAEDQLPLVEIPCCSTTLTHNFVWFAKLSCAWEQVPWLQQELSSAHSSSSSLLQNRHNILKAVSQLQSSLGTKDLGQVYYEPLKDRQGNILLVTLKEFPNAPSHPEPPLQWMPLTRLEKNRSRAPLLPEPTAMDMLYEHLREKLDYHRRSTHGAKSGLYVGILKLWSSVEQIRVLVPQRLPNLLCHTRVRHNAHVTREEWGWLQSNVYETTSDGVQNLLGSKEDNLVENSSLAEFIRALRAAVSHLLTKLNIPLYRAYQYGVYTRELLQLGDKVSMLLLLPPSEDFSSSYWPLLGTKEAGLTMPLQIFELVHFWTYERDFVSQYCRAWVRLDLDTHLAQQALREALDTREVQVARERLNHVTDLSHHLDAVWRDARWIMDCLQCVRSKQWVGAVPLGLVMGGDPPPCPDPEEENERLTARLTWPFRLQSKRATAETLVSMAPPNVVTAEVSSPAGNLAVIEEAALVLMEGIAKGGYPVDISVQSIVDMTSIDQSELGCASTLFESGLEPAPVGPLDAGFAAMDAPEPFSETELFPSSISEVIRPMEMAELVDILPTLSLIEEETPSSPSAPSVMDMIQSFGLGMDEKGTCFESGNSRLMDGAICGTETILCPNKSNSVNDTNSHHTILFEQDVPSSRTAVCDTDSAPEGNVPLQDPSRGLHFPVRNQAEWDRPYNSSSSPLNRLGRSIFSVRMSTSENARSSGARDASQSTSEAELRLALLGKTGSGRSSSGNTILGRPAFGVDISPSSVTTRCTKETGTAGGRCISVIDTPGFFHTHLSTQEVIGEVGRCVALSTLGPHVFLVTLQLGRFTQEESDVLQWIKATFGPEATRFILVLFTWGDQLRGKRAEEFLEQNDELSAFVSGCNGSFHVFDNSQRKNMTPCSQQVEQLLTKINKIVESNGGGCYSSHMFKEAENAIRNTQERILEEKRQRWLHVEDDETEGQQPELQKRQMEEEEEAARRRAERLFWCELLTAIGTGAAEGAGFTETDKGKGKALKKVKVVEKAAAALVTSPFSISSAAKVVGGAVREGSKVLYKHRKTFLH